MANNPWDPIADVRTNPMTPASLDGMGEHLPPTGLPVPLPANSLDSEQNRNSLTQLESWWSEQIDLHAENRREQILDCDYYDRDQWSPQERANLHDRRQFPAVFDLTHPIVDWIVGTERRTRVDWAVKPRKEGDEDSAEAKEKLLKFMSDTSNAEFERSLAFKDSVKCGVGWMREYANNDPMVGPPVMLTHVDWKAVRWDPYGRRNDMKDCRSISIERYLDVDYAMAMFPTRIEQIKSASQSLIDPALELVQDDLMVPAMFNGFRQGVLSGAYSTSRLRGRRARIRLIETEYRRPVIEARIRPILSEYERLTDVLYDPTNRDHVAAAMQQAISLDQRQFDKMWLAIWHPGFLCLHMPSPYKHNDFSLTPIWCYRRHRDGMPYGIIRGLRDPQDEYNKRRSRAVFLSIAEQVIHEEDAFTGADGDIEENLEQLQRPDGNVKVAKGALSGPKPKIMFRDFSTRLKDQVDLMENTRQFMFEGSGVTRENLGLQSGDLSGRAILAKQQQGSVATAEIFDNDRFATQISGRKTLSLSEQYVTLPMEIQIIGKTGAQEWLKVNQLALDPITGEAVWHNDITATECDFVVDERDFRETVRMAMSEMLLEMIGKMPPEMGIKLLDLAVELGDFPNRDEFVRRIRKLNGEAPPDPNDPQQAQAIADQQAAAQAAEEQRQAGLDNLRAKTGKDQAAAAKLNVDAQRASVGVKKDALDTTALLHTMLPLAPAADRLASIPPLQKPPVLPTTPGAQPQPNGYPALAAPDAAGAGLQ